MSEYVTKPRPHAALIKRWADGATIEFRRPGGKWCRFTQHESPSWEPTTEYREVVVRTTRYRSYLWRPQGGGATRVLVTDQESQLQEPRESWAGFIRWLGVWQTVEIEE